MPGVEWHIFFNKQKNVAITTTIQWVENSLEKNNFNVFNWVKLNRKNLISQIKREKALKEGPHSLCWQELMEASLHTHSTTEKKTYFILGCCFLKVSTVPIDFLYARTFNWGKTIVDTFLAKKLFFEGRRLQASM